MFLGVDCQLFLLLLSHLSLKTSALLIQLWSNKIKRSGSFKVTNIPQVFLRCLLIFNKGFKLMCDGKSFHREIREKKLYKKSKFKICQSLLILGDLKWTPFIYMTFFAVLILTSLQGLLCASYRSHCLCLHISPTSHLLPLFSGGTSVFGWHQQATITKCNGFSNTIIRHDERPLHSYRLYIQCTC